MSYQNEYERWLNSDALTAEEKAELVSIRDNEEAKALRFSAPMDFGTAGLRSTMYMGIGCMNRFTVAHTTRGIAALIKKGGGENRGVAIACTNGNDDRVKMQLTKLISAYLGISSNRIEIIGIK